MMFMRSQDGKIIALGPAMTIELDEGWKEWGVVVYTPMGVIRGEPGRVYDAFRLAGGLSEGAAKKLLGLIWVAIRNGDRTFDVSEAVRTSLGKEEFSQ